jgi:hypothetical protein
MPRMELRQGSKQLAWAPEAIGPLLAEERGATGSCQSVLHIRHIRRPKNRPGMTRQPIEARRLSGSSRISRNRQSP